MLFEIKSRRAASGFTLIELLIVIAIIAILALIAIPNFLEAQTRSKLARVRADMRSLATGIETYFTDFNSYPWRDVTGMYSTQYSEIGYRLAALTTPIAYMSSVEFRDPFINTGAVGGYSDGYVRFQYNYRNCQYFSSSYLPYPVPVWVLNCVGPDNMKNQGLNVEYWARGLMNSAPASAAVTIYDPTNGTISAGDIPRTGGETRYKNQ